MTEINGSAPAWNVHDAARIAEARALVETTALSQAAIAARLNVAPTTVSMWKRRGGWTRPPDAPKAPLFIRDAGTAEERNAGRAKKMVDRLYRVFARGVAALEKRLGSEEEGLEKDARALASLARTLETLMALDRDDGAKPPDPEAVDPDEIRARLARRLFALGQGGE